MFRLKRIKESFCTKSSAEDISGRVLKSVLMIVIFLIILIACVVCIFSCAFINIKFDRENRDALNLYAMQMQNLINDGVQKSSNILTWPIISEGLSSTGRSHYKMLEFSYNVRAYIMNISDENTLRFLLYSGNKNVFESKYIRHIDELVNRDYIAEMLKKDNKYIDSNIYEDGDNRYIKIFSDMNTGNGSILECDVILPEYSQVYDIRVAAAADIVESRDTFVKPITDEFSVVLNRDHSRLERKMIVIIGGIIIISLLLMLCITAIVKRSIRKTLNVATNVIRRIGEEDIEQLRIEKYDANETDVEKLKKTVSELMTRLVNVTNEKNKLDIYMLRKQLDPHTLYNSLSVIRLNAYIGGNTEIVTLIDDMMDYYRSILNKGDLYDTIEKELYSIGKFLKIVSASNGKLYTMTSDIEEGLETFEMPSMLLHVFVENSVVHGMSANPNSERVTISAVRSKGSVIIKISDDGYGVDEEKLVKMNSICSDTGNHTAYGLRNAYIRMKMAFGKNVMLSFENNTTAGMTVTLVLPESEENIYE